MESTLLLLNCRSTRGLMLSLDEGLEIASVKPVPNGLKFAAGTIAFTMEELSVVRRNTEKKNEAFLLSGPLKSPPIISEWLSGCSATKGFLELSAEVLPKLRMPP